MKKIGTKSKIKLYIIIEAVLIAMIIGMSIFFGIALNNRRVDFDQNITSADGGEFNSTFDAKGDDDFVVRFADLECNEDCSNVSSVKIGDKTLEVGKDYEVKRGSVIIKIFKKVLQSITNGEHDIVVKIEQDGETITVGVKITITNSTATNEQPEQNTEPENNGGSSQNNPTPEPTPTPAPTPIPEPTPTPAPTPEPQDNRLKVNLNDDSYTVSYVGISYYLMDENREPVPGSSFGIGGYTVKKGETTICESYSNQAGQRGLTEAQFMEEQNRLASLGIYGWDGGGMGGIKLSEKPEYCDICNFNCGRW